MLKKKKEKQNKNQYSIVIAAKDFFLRIGQDFYGLYLPNAVVKWFFLSLGFTYYYFFT